MNERLTKAEVMAIGVSEATGTPLTEVLGLLEEMSRDHPLPADFYEEVDSETADAMLKQIRDNSEFVIETFSTVLSQLRANARRAGH